MSIPNSISYRNVKPLGIPSRVKRTQFTPSNIYGEIKPNDIVRFHIKAPAFWDPYNTYVRVKLDFSDMEAGQVQQLDSSAQSFISEMIVSAGSQELERIQEYDVLAAILMDMSYDNHGRLSKQHEGLSSEILPSNNFHNIVRADNAVIYSMFESTNAADKMSMFAATHGFKPTLKPIANLKHVFSGNQIRDLSQNNNQYLGNLANPVNIMREQLYTTRDSVVNRADKNFVQNRRKGHPGEFLPVHMYPFHGDEDKTVVTTGQTTTIRGGELAHELDAFYDVNVTDPNIEPITHADEYPTIGNINVFSKEYASGCFEDCFSKDSWEYLFQTGKVSTPVKVARTSAEYTFPLLSGVLGILVPRDNYKLFPAFAVDNLTVEFRINPYAVFTGGYKNPEVNRNSSNYDRCSLHLPLKEQYKRTFKILEIEIITDLVQFDDTVTELMRQQLSGEGIILSSSSFSLGPLINIKDTMSVGGTHNLNMGFESLKAIYLAFISNDYMQYSFCRKNYRLSRNITSIQTKIGMEYLPDKAIEGHGGNPYIPNRFEKNNWIYLYELWRTFGHLNDVFQHHIINRHNFAINERPYDVTNTEPYIKLADTNKHWSFVKENNIDTAMGYPIVHENRMVGRAVYVLNYTHNSDGGASLNGINTVSSRPYDIIIKTDPTSGSVNPIKDRPCTMMFFCHYDFLIQISMSGVRVLGRA